MMKRNIVALLVLALALSILPMTAGAETRYGGDGWTVVFSGSDMVSNFKSSDMDDVIYSMEPGDTVYFRVALSSVYSGSTSWYMENKVLKSLEDSRSVASGGAYSYILTYTDAAGETRTLYNSDKVGGEGITEAGEGLHQATVALDDFFFLDNVEKNKPGYVTLQVHLEGETQGNDYQNTLAELQMRFAVKLNATTPPPPSFPTETTAPSDETTGPSVETTLPPTFPSSSTTPTIPKVEEKPPKDVYYENPKTSDASLVMTFSAIMLVSGGAMLYLAVLLWRRREDEER